MLDEKKKLEKAAADQDELKKIQDGIKQINADLEKYQKNPPEDMVQDVVRQIFLPWFNSYRFLIQNISRYEQTNNENFVYNSSMMKNIKDPNLMDKWITSATQSLIKYVRVEMDAYKLYNVVKPLLTFLEKLSNWYVRLNRPRMRGEEGKEE
jgi:isoleucyl-tRNA synthetase